MNGYKMAAIVVMVLAAGIATAMTNARGLGLDDQGVAVLGVLGAMLTVLQGLLPRLTEPSSPTPPES